MSKPPEPDVSLELLRRRLEVIDRTIVLFLAARVDTACSAIGLRASQGENLTDQAQEQRVIARARGWAELSGISPAAASTIFRALVGEGKDRYTRSEAERRPLSTSTPEHAMPRVRNRVAAGSEPGLAPRERTRVET